MIALRLILVRHGETDLNRDGITQGRNSDALNQRGRQQVQEVARALHRETPFALYSSPIVRALETAQVISDEHQVPVAKRLGLAEADLGELEGLTGQELRQLYPDFMRLWDQDPAYAQMPGGESLHQVQDRMWECIMAMQKEHQEGTVIAVTHNLAIIAFLCRALSVPLSQVRNFRTKPGSIAILELQGTKASLILFGDDCHLRPLDDSGQP